MSSPLCLPVEEQQNGERIDKFLQESIPGMSRSQAQKWIAQGFVKSERNRQVKMISSNPE